MATWKYSNLPEHEYSNARQALDNRDLDTLLYLHNRYNMSNVAYCCPDPSLFTFFENLLIKAGA
mgnify:FL=1